PVRKLTVPSPPSRGLPLDRAELALGRLRSTKPRLGEPRGYGTLRRRGTKCTRPIEPAGAGVCERPDAPKGHRGIFARARARLDERAHLALQHVHARIRMRPAVGEAGGVETPEEW